MLRRQKTTDSEAAHQTIRASITQELNGLISTYIKTPTANIKDHEYIKTITLNPELQSAINKKLDQHDTKQPKGGVNKIKNLSVTDREGAAKNIAAAIFTLVKAHHEEYETQRAHYTAEGKIFVIKNDSAFIPNTLEISKPNGLDTSVNLISEAIAATKSASHRK